MHSHSVLLSRYRLWLMAVFFGLALVLAAFGMAAAQAHGPGTVPPSADCHDEDGDLECELEGRVDSIRNAEGGPIISVKQLDFQIVPSTEVDNGPVELDDCVEVTFMYADVEVHPLEEISVKSDDDCRKEDGADDDDEAEFRGRVESFERDADGAGSIVVDNGRTAPQTFLIDQATEFDDDYGMPGEGDCVEVEYDPTTDPPLATEIETKREHHCRGDGGGSGPGDDDRDGEGRLYGTLQSINAAGDLWLISGVSFVVNEETELEPKGDGFDPGDLVKVEFHVVTNAEEGTTQFIAEEIEEKYHREDNGRDDDGDGAYEGVEGKAEGPLQGVADGLWTVGGIDFVVTETTEFEVGIGRDAPPSLGTFVEVKFFLNAEGAREAIEIWTEDDDNDGYWELVGFVTDQPEQRFLGEWGIANVTFVADARTDFEEGRGLLAVGAFVKVEYYEENEGKYIHEIEVHVPPGAGDRNQVGRLERRGAETAAAGVAAFSYWTVGGQSYLVNEATRLNDHTADLVEGATVAVNSYTDGDGTEVATSITGLQLDSTLFLPLIVR